LLVAAVAAVLGSLAYAAYLAGGQLYLKGSLASSSVIEVKGTAYVPVKGVAKALNMTRGERICFLAAPSIALTFQVPEKAVLKDLVYEVYDLGSTRKAKPFRASLKS
jgi:hypothetical protein